MGGVKNNSRKQVIKTAERSYTVTKGEGENETSETFDESIDPIYAEKVSFLDGSAIERFMVMNNAAGLYVTPGTVENGSYTAGLCIGNVCSLLRFDKASEAMSQLRQISFAPASWDLGVYILNSLKGQPYVLGVDLATEIFYSN